MPKLEITSASGLVQKAGSTNMSLADDVLAGALRKVITVTDATKTLALADSGSAVVLDRAAGITLTLPEATSSSVGWYCDVYVKTTFTGIMTIAAGAAADLLMGSVFIADFNSSDAAEKALFVPDQTDDDQLVANADNKGRMAGGHLRLEIVAADRVAVSGILVCNGNAATPFA